MAKSRFVRWLALASVSCSLAAGAAPATAQGTRAGRPFWTGDGTLYYQHGTTMLGPLAAFVALFAAIVDDDDDDDAAGVSLWYEECQCPRWGPHHGRPLFPFEAFQVGSSAGLFVTPQLTAGVRAVAQANGPDDRARSFWGVGPEVAFFPGSASCPLRPFVSCSRLYVRARLAHGAADGGRLAVRSCQFRTGLTWLGATGGFFVQGSYQSRPPDIRRGMPPTRSGWGAGMGLIVYPGACH